jgi:hypothetical protein
MSDVQTLNIRHGSLALMLLTIPAVASVLEGA